MHGAVFTRWAGTAYSPWLESSRRLAAYLPHSVDSSVSASLVRFF